MTKYQSFATAIFALAAMVWLPSAIGQEDSAGPEFKLNLDNSSRYVWRGMEINDEQVMQPSLSMDLDGLKFKVWANYDMTDTGRRGDDNVSEVRLKGSYTMEVEESMEVFFGAIAYVYPGDQFQDDTQEVFAGVKVFVPYLDPTLTVYYDIDEVHGFYGTLGVGHQIPLTDDENLKLDLGASIGYGDNDYNDVYFGTKHGFVDMRMEAGLDYTITDNLSAGVAMVFSGMLDRRNSRAANARFDDASSLWTVWNIALNF